jgi:hypothetical protein
MEKESFPSKRTGFWVLLVLLLGAIGGILYVLSAASQAAQQTVFMVNLLAAVVLIAVGIWLLLRMHTLLITRYMLSRGGLELRWGLRHEVIPMPEIVWIRPVSEFKSKLPLPALSLPGVYFGKKQVRGLGTVEFAATDRRKFLLVACRERYFVISPQEEHVFLDLFERLTELGSLESFAPLSEGFGSLWNRVWRDLTARHLILGGLAANVVLLVLALALASLQPSVTWATLEIVPSQRLLLLPLLGLLAWFVDVCAGVVFYLQEALEKPMVYLLWGMPTILALLLAAAMLIMAL